MDITKGGHALATSASIIITVSVLFNFFNTFISSVPYPIVKNLLWVSFGLMIFSGALLIPALIAFSDTSNANIVSMFTGFFTWIVGAFAIYIASPAVAYFIGTDTQTGFLQGTPVGQFISIFFVVAAGLMMFVGPILLQLAPDLLTEKLFNRGHNT